MENINNDDKHEKYNGNKYETYNDKYDKLIVLEEIFLNLYNDCKKFKLESQSQNRYKGINCDHFYNINKFFKEQSFK